MALFGRSRTPKRETVEVDLDGILEERPDTTPKPRTVAAQREFLLSQVSPLRPFGMHVLDVAGLPLCEDIASDLDLPLVTSSRVDGYGVRSANLVGASASHPIDLRLVGEARAGDLPRGALPAGGTVSVAAGAAVPEGVDAVVPTEDAERAGDDVLFVGEASLGQHLHRRGSELADGAALLSAGTVLNPRSIALLAEVGLDKVLVRPRPRVVVLAANSTLVTPGQPLTGVDQRYDSGTALLTASARTDGATVYPVGVVDLTPSALRQTLVDQAIRADLLVILGGVDQDVELVTDVMSDLGPIDVAMVGVNGGAVYGFGRIGTDGVPVLLLPGGAVSAFVGYQLFVRPMLARLADAAPAVAPRRRATLGVVHESQRGQAGYVPAILTGDQVCAVSAPSSELAYDLHRANVLMVVPEDAGALAAGDSVECLLLDDADEAASASEGRRP